MRIGPGKMKIQMEDNSGLKNAGDLKRRSLTDDGFKLHSQIYPVVKIMEHVRRIKRPLEILDIGCGTCIPLEYLLSSHVIPARYTGVDGVGGPFQKWMGTKIFRGFVKDVRDLSWLPEQFDVVVSTEVLEHMPKADGQRMLASVKKRLRKDGVFVLTTPGRYPGLDPEHEFKTHGHHYLWDPQELKTHMRSIGFELREVSTGKYMSSPVTIHDVRRASNTPKLIEWMEQNYGTNLTTYMLSGFYGLGHHIKITAGLP